MKLNRFQRNISVFKVFAVKRLIFEHIVAVRNMKPKKKKKKYGDYKRVFRSPRNVPAYLRQVTRRFSRARIIFAIAVVSLVIYLYMSSILFIAYFSINLKINLRLIR